MFGIESSELAVIAVIALLVIGPKDLPRVMRMVGNWMAKGRAMTRHVRAGFDTMMREAELEEMQKIWASQNDAIMQATSLPDLSITGAPAPAPADPLADDWMQAGPDPRDPEPEPAATHAEAAIEQAPPRPSRSMAALPDAAPDAAAPKPTKPRARRAAADPDAPPRARRSPRLAKAPAQSSEPQPSESQPSEPQPSDP